MLRQGRAFADVCYYYGEDVPNTAWYFVPGVMDPRQKMKPVLPIGYDYDVCDRTILDLMRVEDGVVVLPSGMRYKYLVLPDSARYTPAALEKVLELVMAGATVIGPKPSVSPSLSDYPNADKKIQELAAQIWPQTADATERRVGKGRVITEKSFEKILQKDGLRPDFKATSQAKDSDVQYTHRVLPKGDLYFVSNQKDRAEEVVLDFRVTGMAPELWDPATGKSTELAMYQDDGTSTTIPLRLDSSGSQFLVFKKAAAKKAPVVELLKDGQSLRSVKGGAVALPENTASIEATAKGGLRLNASEAGRYTLSFADGAKSEVDVKNLPAPEIVPEKWNVTFQKDRSAPEGGVPFDKLVSWTNRPEDGIRYFSGTASYEQGVNVSQERLQSGKRVYRSGRCAPSCGGLCERQAAWGIVEATVSGRYHRRGEAGGKQSRSARDERLEKPLDR
ncbi:MAG: hypothetical protein EBS96_13840 [Spartobacteria bacterium]|nr:hypothetical protein [Spartobacteria bacterium]